MNKVSRLSIPFVLIILTTSLSACSDYQVFTKKIGSLCADIAKATATGYSKATTPAAQKIAEDTVNSTISVGEEVAELIAGDRPGVAKDIQVVLNRLRERKTLSSMTGDTVTTLREQKAIVTSALDDLGKLCVKAVTPVD